jgi:hypothetical protein
MGGGRLDAIFEGGWYGASFSAYADLLIYYEPFQFQADIGVMIAGHAEIGPSWCSVHVGAEISAALELHGPPVAGSVGIDLTVFHFTVEFGQGKKKKDPIEFADFYKLVTQSASADEAEKLPAHMLSVENGRLVATPVVKPGEKAIQPKPKPEDPPLTPQTWRVRAAQFQFVLEARFPVLNITGNQGTSLTGNPIYSLPMHLGKDKAFTNSQLDIDITNDKSQERANFVLERILKPVPGALWNPCKF